MLLFNERLIPFKLCQKNHCIFLTKYFANSSLVNSLWGQTTVNLIFYYISFPKFPVKNIFKIQNLFIYFSILFLFTDKIQHIFSYYSREMRKRNHVFLIHF